MSKKFSKLLLSLTAACAAGAGIYYWLKNKKESEPEEEFDENFEEEDFDLDDDLDGVSERGYVTLTPSEKPETAEGDSSDQPEADNEPAEVETTDDSPSEEDPAEEAKNE